MTRIAWMKKNLFSTKLNSFLTILWICIAVILLPKAINWLFINSTWLGNDISSCTPNGACWIFIKLNFSKIIYGLYPRDQYWRIHIIAITLVTLILLMFIDKKQTRQMLWFGITIIGFPIFSIMMLYGVGPMTKVPTSYWGGITLNLIIAVLSLILSTPYGILLALGRQSKSRVYRYISTILIEFIRGVPLITLLFMAAIMLPLFFPPGIIFDKITRIIFVLTIFGGAYIAECVRGGLSSIPKGQYECSQSLALGYFKMMIWVILPQALRVSLPSIVNTFIAITKDTSLVTIIGLLDILGMMVLILSDITWSIYFIEGYITLAFIFWIICFSLSCLSKHIEKRYSIKQ